MFTTMSRKWTSWHRRRIAIRRLQRLDDWLLADLGTQRDDIASFVQRHDSD